MALATAARWSGEQWEPFEYRDPVGDIGVERPWVDISSVHLTPGVTVTGFGLELAASFPGPRPEPSESWMAYGVVLDADGDGAPDVRLGIDNFQGQAHRAWRTDLDTGRTSASAGPPYGYVGPDRIGLDTWFPGGSHPTAILRYFPQRTEEAPRFYGWASIIEGGTIVATDYAPNAGWLVAGEDPGLPLVGSRWVIGRDFGSMGIEYTLRFEPDRTFSIDTCNPGTGVVAVGTSSIVVTDFRLAANTCSSATFDKVSEFEASVFRVLSAEKMTYTLDAGTLSLSARGSDLRFSGLPAPTD